MGLTALTKGNIDSDQTIEPWAMKIFGLLFLVILQRTQGSYANGSSCHGYLSNSLEDSINSAETASQVYVARRVEGDDPGYQYYKSKVRKVYKGCSFKRSDLIFVKTPDTLEHNTKYVLFGSISFEHISGYIHKQIVLTIDVCAANIGFYHVSLSDRYNLRKLHQTNCNIQSYRSGSGTALPPSGGRIQPPSGQSLNAYSAQQTCSRNDCASLPYNSESRLCPDGETTSGITGHCGYNPSSSKCEWEVRVCPSCQNDSGCRSDQICTGGFCAPAQCGTDSQCAFNELCDSGRCVPCSCDHSGRPEYQCHDLIGRGNVSGECYRAANGKCIAEYSECAQCSSDSDCLILENGICIGGQCESAQCLSDDHCGYNEVCDGYQCVTCDCGFPDRDIFLCHDQIQLGNVVTDCSRSPNGQCVFEYSECAECGSDKDCYDLDKGICVGGQCESAQCLFDDHCAYDEVCNGYQCVPCNCGPPTKVEFLCHDLIGMGNVAGECYRAPNGQCIIDYSRCADCRSDTDCQKLDKGVCVNGQCESAQCLVDEHCPYETPFCLSGHCSE